MKNLYPGGYKLNGQYDKTYTDKILEENSETIHNSIISNKPLMVSRFGSTELNCLVNYIDVNKNNNQPFDYITGNSKYIQWERHSINAMCYLSGFFPDTVPMLERFCELIIDDMKYIDILGSWLKEETVFDSELANSTKMGLMNLEPYNHVEPWSRALEGKTVLVIHPFDSSIKNQYANRKLLFEDKRVLPDFELKTLKAVQSISMNSTDFKSWFDALDSMKSSIDDINFDIAIIGCGAYGMPLAAHVKKKGKQAVHLGGSTQILFGITGKRWESEEYDYKEKFINEHWIRPMEAERPRNHEIVEDSCYW